MLKGDVNLSTNLFFIICSFSSNIEMSQNVVDGLEVICIQIRFNLDPGILSPMPIRAILLH